MRLFLILSFQFSKCRLGMVWLASLYCLVPHRSWLGNLTILIPSLLRGKKIERWTRSPFGRDRYGGSGDIYGNRCLLGLFGFNVCSYLMQNQMFIQSSGNHLFCQSSDGQVRKSVVLWEKREKCVQELLIIQFKLAILSNIWPINCGSDILLNKYFRRRDGSLWHLWTAISASALQLNQWLSRPSQEFLHTVKFTGQTSSFKSSLFRFSRGELPTISLPWKASQWIRAWFLRNVRPFPLKWCTLACA